MVNIPEFQLLLVGDSGVGKTALMERIVTGEFDLGYVANIAVETRGCLVYSLVFHTNQNLICFQCWEINDNASGDDQRDGYFTNGQCAIIMFDVTSRISFQHVAAWYNDFVRVCGDIPIVLCGTKVDAQGRRTHVKQVNLTRKIRLPYFEISACSDSERQLREPFEWLVRKLTGDVHTYLTDPLPYCPPDVVITAEQIARLGAENAAAAALVPLPDGDEDL